jgi:hypothetical protein
MNRHGILLSKKEVVDCPTLSGRGGAGESCVRKLWGGDGVFLGGRVSPAEPTAVMRQWRHTLGGHIFTPVVVPVVRHESSW